MKNKMYAVLSALVVVASVMTGCSSLSKNYGLNTPTPELLPLHRDEYLILGDTEGQACERYLLGGQLPWFSGTPSKTVNMPGSGGFLASIPIIGGLFGGNQPIVSAALYNAIDKMPGADSIMSVRVVTHKTFWFPLVSFIYSEECATVKGKAFQYKTDKG